MFDSLIIRGDNIKKNIGVIMMAVLLAYFFSKIIFSSYESEQVMISSGNIYLLQYGSYINKEVMNENIEKLDNYIIYEHDDKYYVYLGAYTNIETAKKMQKYFEKNNIYTYIKNDYLSNLDIVDKITRYDKKIFNEKDFNKNNEYNKNILDILKKSVF